MKKSPGSRKPNAHLYRKSLDKPLAQYALAATAAGMALLTDIPLQAEVVYTPTNVTIARGSLSIDLNADGIGDFLLVDNFYSAPRSKFPLIGSRRLVVGGNASASAISSKGEATVLNSGAVIGSSRVFQPVHQPRLPMAAAKQVYRGSTGTCCVEFYGPWQNVKNRYLGFKFKINGETHFGWARVTVKSFVDPNNYSARINATLSGYAYETNPNQSIIAGNHGPSVGQNPAPGISEQTLGSLAAGAQGLAVWRKQSPASPELQP